MLVNQQKDINAKKVLIIGAGSAGLAAASDLKSKGYQVQIFEASSDFGGRVKKLQGWADYDIESGAEELHYKNSWYGQQLQKINGLKWISDENTDDYVQHPETNKICNFEEDKLIQETLKIDQYFQKFGEYVKQMQKGKTVDFQEISMEKYIELNKLTEKFDTKHIFNSLYAVEFGCDLKDISTLGLGYDEIAYIDGNDDPNWYLFSGKTHQDIYSELFQNIMNDINYNTIIKQIKYKNNNNGQTNSSNVEIIDSQGNVYQGDYVVVCVPITQLQNDKILFQPQLPEEKQIGINTLKMEKCVKLHMKFSKKFWHDDTKDILIKGRINFLWDSSSGRSQKEYVLGGLVFGKEAENFETNKEDLIKDILQNLSQCFEINTQELFINYVYFDWGNQPYIEGGYTYPVLNQGNSRQILKKNINDCIFFAGEAVSEKFFATIHGALQTGLDASYEIQNLKKIQ